MVQASKPFENRTFCPVFEWLTSLGHLAAILFLKHFKTGPFKIQTKVNHSKTGHVRFSDPHCTSYGTIA